MPFLFFGKHLYLSAKFWEAISDIKIRRKLEQYGLTLWKSRVTVPYVLVGLLSCFDKHSQNSLQIGDSKVWYLLISCLDLEFKHLNISGSKYYNTLPISHLNFLLPNNFWWYIKKFRWWKLICVFGGELLILLDPPRWLLSWSHSYTGPTPACTNELCARALSRFPSLLPLTVAHYKNNWSSSAVTMPTEFCTPPD